jgi:hypothetical protein
VARKTCIYDSEDSEKMLFLFYESEQNGIGILRPPVCRIICLISCLNVASALEAALRLTLP